MSMFRRFFIPPPDDSDSRSRSHQDPESRPEPSPADTPFPDLETWLGRIHLADPQPLEPLEIHPLILDGPTGRPFLMLHRALAERTFWIVERGQGVVNEVMVHNAGTEPVLVLEGELIVGSKQNRVVAISAVVAPGEKTSLHVGCVEHGRWHHVSTRFAAGETPLEPGLRRHRVREVAAMGHLDQQLLWEQVHMTMRTRSVASPTGDYHESVRAARQDTVKRSRHVERLPGQVGIIALWQGRLVGLDLLSHPAEWEEIGERIVRSYAMTADTLVLDPRFAPQGGGRTAAEWWKAIARSGLRRLTGDGRRFALAGPGFHGALLWYDGRPAHLAAFGD